ncbi:MAG: dockerin type I repeat-containing protein [bacterium]
MLKHFKARYIALSIILVAAICTLTSATIVAADSAPYICGDVDGDGAEPNVGDLTYLVNYLFVGGSPPPVIEAADVDRSGEINVGDLTYLVAYLFTGGSAPLCPLYHEDISGGCVSGATARTEGAYDHQEITGDCAGYQALGDSGHMFVELIGDDLHIHHVNAFYQCCLKYYVTYDIDGYSITAYESDTSDYCYCMCYFNLESILYDLDVSQPCEYLVTLIGIEGDTVGIDTAVVGGPDYVSVEVIGNDLHINHLNAYYQCCLMYTMDYQVAGFSITAREHDTGALCDCYCYFNLKSVLYDLENGQYIVTVIGIFGDTIWIDTVNVNYTYNLLGYEQSGCLKKLALADPPDIIYTYSGGTLVMQHSDAYFNCGAELMVFFEQAGDTLRFYEINTSGEYAFCMCYFEVGASVADIPPGTYVAEVYSEEPLVLVDQRVLQLGD